jgi:hypothetical protein
MLRLTPSRISAAKASTRAESAGVTGGQIAATGVYKPENDDRLAPEDEAFSTRCEP